MDHPRIERSMNYTYPAAFIMNSYSITAMLIFFGFAGESQFAADIGLIQGAMLALFYAFSANSRNIILNNDSNIAVNYIVVTRLILIVPLAIIAFIVSVYMNSIDMTLVVTLVMRRSIEWIGEVHLGLKETSSDYRYAKNYTIIEGVLFTLVVIWYLLKIPLLVIGMICWAIVPLIMHIPIVKHVVRTRDSLRSIKQYVKLLLPNIGSTLIIGVSVYVFRLLIVLVAGKNTAGDLFTAFALGGMIGSLFAQILGPSVVLYESRLKIKYFTKNMHSLLLLYCAGGIAVYIAALFNIELLNITGKSPVFWSAVGASMVGGVIMVFAQHSKCRLLQLAKNPDLFGPDLYINIILIASVPYFYYIVNLKALATLTLVNAVLSLLIYRSTENEYRARDDNYSRTNKQIVAAVIALLILFPLFIQIQGGVFREPFNLNFDSGGLLSKLPIPISVIGCFAGIIFVGHFRRAHISLGVIFILFMIMLISGLISTSHQNDATSAKLLFLLQFMLPMFALVLGQQYEMLDNKMLWLQRIFLFVLCLIAPVQLISTWFQGKSQLSPYLYAFSIYQHWQYVPVVFTSAYLITLYGLWHVRNYKITLIIITVIMMLYVAASRSITAVLLFIMGTITFLMYLCSKDQLRKRTFIIMSIIVSFTVLYIYTFKDANSQMNNIDSDFKNSRKSYTQISTSSIEDRLSTWNYYIVGAVRNIKAFLIGNPIRPERSTYPSAQNYYLDILYNYGFISLIPLIFLIWVTVYRSYKIREEIISSPVLIGIIVVLFFILFIENSFNVALRQPYSGIFSFFLWGILLSKLFPKTQPISSL